MTKAGSRRGRVRAAIGAITVLAALSAGTTTASAEEMKVKLAVSAERFKVKGNHLVAKGPVDARVRREDGSVTTASRRSHFRVNTTKKCRILELNLARLYINLLGLEVRTSEINAEIKGDGKRALGRLFCKLSKGLKLDKKLLAKRSARTLNRRLDDRPMHLLRFSAPVETQQAPERSEQPASSPETTEPQQGASTAAKSGSEVPPVPPGSCEVLDLLLGPLHLDLLGLVVDLYGKSRKSPIRVLATANPNGGAVGAALCEVAGEPSTEPEPAP